MSHRIGNFFLAFLISYVFFAVELPAQERFRNPTIIDMDDGLPSNYITAIAKDSDGFMWFGTDNGLCRWDGISAVTFIHDRSDRNSISHNFIGPDALLWDDKINKLLIGTENGLSIYNPVTGIFENLYPGEGNPVASGNHISAIIKDRQGVFWITTDNGFVRFDYAKREFRNFYYQDEFNASQLVDTIRINTTLAISQDLYNDSLFWIGTRSGLLKFNKYTEVLKRFYYECQPENIEYASNVFRSVCAHPDGNLYLGTWTGGMTIFHATSEKFLKNIRSLTDKGNSSSILGTNPPLKLKSDHEIWLPTTTALTIFDTEKEKIVYAKSHKNLAGRFCPLWLNYVDEKGRLWCGSRYGVYVFGDRKQQFDNYAFETADMSKDYFTNDIFEDRETGNIFIAQNGVDGLYCFNPHNKSFTEINFPGHLSGELAVNSIFQSTDGIIWVVCPYGIFNVSANRQKLSTVTIIEEPYPWLQDIIEDKNGILWVSSLNSGLQRLDRESGKLENIKNWREFFESDKNIPDIMYLQVDKYNRIWYTRKNGGYGYYDVENDSVKSFSIESEYDTVFYHLCEIVSGKNHKIYAGGFGTGLGFIDPDLPGQGVQPDRSVKNGFIGSSVVYYVREDSKDRLWMLTGAGLEMIDPVTGQIVLFDQDDGLITYDTFSNRSSYYPGRLEKLADGKMVIGYRRGLGFFHPDSLVPNKENPRPYLTSLKVFEKEMITDSALYNKKHLNFKYSQNFLTFEYSAIALTAGKGTQFYHLLEGIDREWIESSLRYASYSNLAPGDYIFRVKAKSKYNIWSDSPLELHISILPPWWKTWWAYSVYFLIFTGSLFGFYRFQLNRQLVKREASRLKEMDEIKSRLYANITHEFRTPLTVITGMTDEIRSRLKPAEHKRMHNFLEMIRRNAGNLLHLINQMLDLSKLESGMLELKPIQADVVSYIKYICESFQSFAESKGINLVFYNECENTLMDYDPDKIFTIVSNLISNALKYTSKGGKVICHLNTSVHNASEQLVVKITDTGIGIPADKLPNIFDRFYQVDGTSTRKGEGTGIGLSLVKELVDLMQGTIAVKSVQGKGSEFILSLPVTRKARQVAALKPGIIDMEFADKRGVQFPVKDSINDVAEDLSFKAEEYPITLIIEDNADVANYIAICLGKNYNIYFAKDGREGIDMAVKHIPDIIICDVMMPERDGFEVCSILKQDERTSHIPIILLTAKATRDDRLTGLKHGADAYLTKPFDKKELLIRMEKMIELRQSLREKFSQSKDSLKRSLSVKNKEDQFLHRAITSIESNLDNPEFGPIQLARLSNMSESQLYRKLKALTGKSTALFIRSVRLQKAREMLQTTTFNVSEIAYMTGFNDPAWFSRVFKEEFGESPGVFRSND